MTQNGDSASIDSLWDYGDPAATEEKFQALLQKRERQSADPYRLQVITQIARTHSLRGNFEQAHRLLDEVEIQMAGDDIVEVRYLLERGRSFNSSGEAETAVPLFQRAVEIAAAIRADFYHVDALHMLGIAAPPAERMGWNLQALAVAKASDDARAQRWRGSLLNNIGWTQFDEENYAAALTTFEETAAFYADNPQQAQNYDIARWSIAKTLRLLGQPDEALTILRELEASGKVDGFTMEELGESLLALGERETAVSYFAAAHEKLSQIGWVAEDGARMQRLARLSHG